MSIESFIAYAPGKYFNPDNAYGFQCKDLIDSYVMDLFPGKSWTETIRPGNANVCFDGANPAYFDKIRNNPKDVNLIPKRGDIICWGGNKNNGFGHIAIVTGADIHGVNVIQQDGYLQCAAYQGRLGYDNPGTGMVQGWLRPKVANPGVKTQTVHLPKTAGSWNVYRENGPYTVGNQIGTLLPKLVGGMTFNVIRWVAGGTTAVIQTRDFGRVAVYVAKGTGAVIS